MFRGPSVFTFDQLSAFDAEQQKLDELLEKLDI
jgi:hypothetical protein